MNCTQCTEQLMALICAELSAEQDLLIHQHLSECDACREVYLEQAELYFSLHGALNVQTSLPELDEEHMSAVLAEALKLDEENIVDILRILLHF